MGGYRSGSHRDRGAKRTGSMREIDLSWLSKRKLLTPGVQTKLSWNRNDEPAGEIRFRALYHGIQLEYKFRSGEEHNWETVNETIHYGYTDTPFNGKRRWFICPSCNERCRILYGGRYYRCRKCHGLTYDSQYLKKWERPEYQADRIIQRLGGHPNDCEFPDKPRCMHWTTYYKWYDKFHKFDCADVNVWYEKFNLR